MNILYNFLVKQLYCLFQKPYHIVCFVCLVISGFTSEEIQSENLNTESLTECYSYCQCNSTNVYCNRVESMLSAVPDWTSKRVKEIYCSNNAIETIKKNDFSGLEFLQTLDLANNNISSIHANAFDNLYQLEILNLADNKLTDLGLTFQHLVSLHLLDLQNNFIKNINRYAFLYVAAASKIVSINLDNNPVQCDCETSALKNWKSSLSEIITVEITMQCANAVNRSYTDVDDSEFDFCNSTDDDFINTWTECHNCTQEATDRKCYSQRLTMCSKDENVCQRTVEWDASRKTMLISSKCNTYQICLENEAKNRETCGLEFQADGNVSCNFCCIGNNCADIGGRTRDFTFTVIYTELCIPNFTEKEFINRIINGIKSAITSITVGIDVDLVTFNNSNSNEPIQQNKAVFLLHVTAFSNYNQETIREAINQDLIASTKISTSALFTETGTLILSSYFEGLECNISTSICPERMDCLQMQNEKTLCLCDDESFFLPSKHSCSSLMQLQVTNIYALIVTDDRVILAWTAQTYSVIVSYEVQLFPNIGQVVADSVSSRGAIVSHLKSGTQYSFTVTSIFTNKFYTKMVNSSVYEVWTKAVHGNPCDPSAETNGNKCGEVNMQCVLVQTAGTRCLCDSGYYFSSSCRNETELQVKNLNLASSTTDTVILMWTSDKFGTNVTYRVQPSPNTGQEATDYASVNGVKWIGLNPGTQYNFTVTSILPADNLYPERQVAVAVITVSTKFTFGMECTILFDMCTTNMTCHASLDNKNRCLCDGSTFYVDSSETCLPSNELQVKNLISSSTPYTVNLTWTAESFGSNVSYTMQPYPYVGQVVADSVSNFGAQWSGLYPGVLYMFTITSTLTNIFYTETYKISQQVWTKAVHGNSCQPYETTDGTICSGNNIECRDANNEGRHCLCLAEYYLYLDNNCRNATELQVKDLNASSTTDTVILNWTSDKHGTNVIYRAQPSPLTGQEATDYVNESGAKWIDLNPGTQYNFTVISILPGDNLYPIREVATSVITVWTKIAKNVTIFASYIRQNAEYQSFMENPSSLEYVNEDNRIVIGVKYAISKAIGPVDVQVSRFMPIRNRQYKVILQIEVVTFDPDVVESDINEAIQSDTNDPKGFFFNEHLKSLEVSSNVTGSQDCPYSVTSSSTGVFKWDAAKPGLYNAGCPFNNPMEYPLPLASRSCLQNSDGLAEWGEVDDSMCISRNIKDSFGNITTDNARIVSSLLKSYTESLDNFTAKMMDETVQLLEQLAIEDNLAEPEVAMNVIGCVSNLVNVNVKTLQESEAETAASRRLLSIIDTIPNKTPLVGGQLKVITSNLAVAAQEVNSTEIQDLVLVTDTDTSMQKDSMVSIDLSSGYMTSIEGSNKTSLAIPMQALLDSLTPEDKNNLTRISFIVHRSDILFATIKHNADKKQSGTVTTNNSDNGKLPDSNDDTKKKSSIFVTKINSYVISASVPGIVVSNLRDNITMNFEHVATNSTNARCVFWNESLSNGRGAWSDEGCGIVKSYAGGTTCGCNHLTNFALLMDVYGEGSHLSDLDRKILSIISYVGCGISLLALLLTLLTYSLFRTLRRDNPSKILINLCLALLFSNLIFLVGMQDYAFDNISSCKAVAVLLHYFLLSSMTWMAVEAFYMYLALVLVFKTYFTNFILKCSLVGWGVPLVIIVITLAVNTTDNYGFLNSGLCWLKNPAFYAAFVGPVSCILLINCLAFILVVKQLINLSSSRLHKSDRNSTIQRLRGAVGVVILLGLSWLFAIFAIDEASLAFYYLFAIFNSFQGLFIFIFYCLLKREAVVSFKRLMPCFEEYGDTSKSYTNSRGATNSAGHRLSEQKSGFSKFNGNTRSTNSTNTDSRKDSCFSTLSSSNIMFDVAEIDEPHSYADADTDAIISTSSFSSQPQENIQTVDDLPSRTSPKSENIDSDFENIIQNLNKSCKGTTPESQLSSNTDHQSEKTSYSIYTTETLSDGPLSPHHATEPLNLPQTFIQDSEQIESSQSNSPVIVEHNDSDAQSYAPNETFQLSLSTFNTDAEIDYSHTESVRNIKNKFEYASNEKSSQKINTFIK